jgi:hypothetical protein
MSAVTTGEARTSAFPAQWFDGLLRALPGVHDLLVTVARKSSSCTLNTSPGAPGPHAFAVRTRILRLTTRARPSHSAPRVVTIAIRPSCRGGMRGMDHRLPKNGREYFFAIAEILLDAAGKSLDRSFRRPSHAQGDTPIPSAGVLRPFAPLRDRTPIIARPGRITKVLMVHILRCF